MFVFSVEIWNTFSYMLKISTQTYKKQTLKTVANEVSMLRSFFIGAAGQDTEGAYRPEFVENILRVSANAVPRREFVGTGDFLRRIKQRA